MEMPLDSAYSAVTTQRRFSGLPVHRPEVSMQIQQRDVQFRLLLLFGILLFSLTKYPWNLSASVCGALLHFYTAAWQEKALWLEEQKAQHRCKSDYFCLIFDGEASVSRFFMNNNHDDYNEGGWTGPKALSPGCQGRSFRPSSTDDEAEDIQPILRMEILRFQKTEGVISSCFHSPMHENEKWKWGHSVVSDSQRPHGLQDRKSVV